MSRLRTTQSPATGAPLFRCLGSPPLPVLAEPQCNHVLSLSLRHHPSPAAPDASDHCPGSVGAQAVSWHDMSRRMHEGGRLRRHGPQAGYFKAVSVDEKGSPEGGFSIVFDWSANSKSINEGTSLEFIPPAYNGCAPRYICYTSGLGAL